MRRVEQLVRNGGPGAGQRQLVYGEVSRRQPPPQGFNDPLYIVIPDYSPDIFYQCVAWPAMHGHTLPRAGTPCLIAFDDRHQCWCVSWVGSFTQWQVGSDVYDPD